MTCDHGPKTSYNVSGQSIRYICILMKHDSIVYTHSPWIPGHISWYINTVFFLSIMRQQLTVNVMILSNNIAGAMWKSNTKYWKQKITAEIRYLQGRFDSLALNDRLVNCDFSFSSVVFKITSIKYLRQVYPEDNE